VTQPLLDFGDSPWIAVRDGDPRLRPIYNRHYSSRGSTAPKISGPGEYVALLTPAVDALLVWRRFRDMCRLAPEGGVNCAVFRRENGPLKASALILAAEPFAFLRWGPRTLYTYVAPSLVRAIGKPGWCFRKAGWHELGETAGGHGRPRLLVLAKSP
jgi:hypothetical protein